MKKLQAKILFDILLTLTWTVLMVYPFTGAFLHEVLGIIAGGLFLIHIGYNIPLVKNTSRFMFKKGHGIMTVKYMLDIILTISVIFTILSGILISKEVLVGISVSDFALWTWLHNWAAYLALIVMSIHIGLHWQMIITAISSPFRTLSLSPAIKRAGKVAWNLMAVGIIVYGLIASINYDIPSYTPAQSSSDLGDNTQQDKVTISNASISFDTAANDQSLEDYLGNMTCTACHRMCSLLSPQCGRGVQQAQAAEEEFYNSGGSQDSQESQDPGSSYSDDQQDQYSNDYDDNYSDDQPDQYFDDQQDQDTNNRGNVLDDTGNPDTDNDSDNSSARSSKKAVGALDNSFGNILSIMGMYIGGTYYVTRLSGKKKLDIL